MLGSDPHQAAVTKWAALTQSLDIQGAKSAQRRERSQKEGAKGDKKSQLKVVRIPAMACSGTPGDAARVEASLTQG